MKSEVFVEQEIKAGCRAHYNQGVWWQEHVPGFCKPLLPLHSIKLGSAAPLYSRSLIGYEHLTSVNEFADKRITYFVIREPALRSFCFERLIYEKRKAVAKAKRSNLVVARLTDLAPLWNDMREIAISMAERTGYGKPADYYRNHFPAWRQSISREFFKPQREWWGVFKGNRLGAYMYTYLIDDTMHLVNTKVHSEFMSDRASDYLYFTVLEYCGNLPECKLVNTGHSSGPSVDRFKESLGFERIEFGDFYSCRVPVRFALRCVQSVHRYLKHGKVKSNLENSSHLFAKLYRRALGMSKRVVLK